MKAFRKMLAITLVAVMTVLLMPAMKIAANTVEPVSYMSWNGARLDEDTCCTYTLVTSGDTTWGNGWYVVEGVITIEHQIICSGEVHLILKDGANLTVNNSKNDGAGICVSGTGNSLTIYGQSKQTGKLVTTGGAGGAGIGSNRENVGENITINGGDVTADAGSGAAGIGGGSRSGSCKNITINGGTVTANAGTVSNGAGIGGGSGGNGTYITINGGTVTANGGVAAGGAGAGIGGGSGGCGTNITINGGTVTANGGVATGGAGAGIGSGYNGNAASDIYVAAYMAVNADVSTTPPTTEIVKGHSITQDIAADLAGKRYATVKDFLSEHIIVLKGGKAYLDSTSGSDVTNAVKEKGLSYDDTTSTWTMKNFNFTTSAAKALEFADSGTSETPAAININVVGTNNIVSENSSSAAAYGMYFSQNNANVTISGSGAGSSVLNVTGGNMTSNAKAYGLYSSANSLTLKELTATFTSGTSTNGTNGVYANGGPFIVENGAIVTCTARGNNGKGLFASSLKVTGTGKLVAVGEDKAIMTMGSKPDARAVQTELTWDNYDNTYKNNNEIATNVTLTSTAFISVGDQTGTLTYDTAGSATYSVSLIAVTEPDSFTVTWYDKDDKVLSAAPNGVTVSYDKNKDTFTVNTTAATPAGTYKFTLTAAEESITSGKAALTVNAKNISTCTVADIDEQMYNGNALEPAVTVKDGSTTLQKGTDYTLSYKDSKAAAVEAANLKNAGTYTVTVTGTGNYKESVDKSYTISPKELTITGTTVANKAYDGTTNATVTAGTLSGVVTGDSVQIDTATGTFADKNVGEDKDVTVKYTLKGDKAGNYTISDEALTAEISPLQLTVTGTAADGKDYDGTTDAVIGTMGALTGVLSGDAVSIDTDKCEASFAAKDVGNSIDVTVKYALKGAGAGNYTVSDSTTCADIEKKVITVKPDANQSKAYMYADPVLTYTYSGNMDGETPVFDGVLTRAAGDDITAEGYAIGLGTLALKDNGTFKASNYELELDGTTVYFFVTKAKIDLPVAAENLIYTGNEQYGISTIFGALYSVTGTKSATDAGKYTVTAELNDKDNFEWNLETPTSENQQIEWEIAKRSITLTSGSASKIADGEPLTSNEVTVSGDGFVTGEGFDYTVTGSQTEIGESKNTFTYTAKAGTNADNYDVTKVEGTLAVDKLPVIIGGAGQTIDLGKAEGAEFVSNASIDKFIKVTVDGNDVDAKYYTVVSGSTKVTLTKEYLQTLSAGKHTIDIISTTGTAEAEFTVTGKAPNTGDSSNVLLYLAAALFSIAGAVLLRKKKFSV